MRKISRVAACWVLGILIFALCACGKENESDNNAAIYGETIGKLEDNELFSIIDTNASLPILLVTSQVYDDMENQVALSCDVYYLVDREVKKIGTIESLGTAYPISYDKSGIYTASGHDMQCYEIEKSGTIKLKTGIYEQFDESGNSSYRLDNGDKTAIITEEEYYTAFKKYSNASVVNFSYGAK